METDTDSHWLGELLAVIHRDGGHYQATHGTEKATIDAVKIVNALRSDVDRLEYELAAFTPDLGGHDMTEDL